MEKFVLPHDHGHRIPQPEHIPTVEELTLLADVFKLLGDASRVRIFWLLCHCEACVINLSAMMRMSSPAVSHHLKLLRAHGLIISRREGKEVYYKAADTALARQLHAIVESTMEITCPGAENLM